MPPSGPQNIRAQTLKLETIPLVANGVVALQFDALLKQAVTDCEQRCALDKAREVNLKVKMIPLTTSQGVLEEVHVEFEMSQKVPGFSTNSQSMLVRNGERLLFQPLSPEDARQDPLPGLQPGERIDPATGEIRRD